MKKSKKILAIIMCAIVCITLMAACGGNGSTNNDNTNASTNTGSTNTGSTNTGSTGSGSTPASSSPSPQSAAASFTPPPDTTVKYREHIDIVLDNNTVNVINQFGTAGSVNSTWTYEMILDTLVRDEGDPTKEKFGVFPFLATSFDTVDFKTYKFTIRQDVNFHNGEHLTTDDIAWTIEYAQSENALGSSPNTYWGQVETVNVIDDYNIELTLKEVNVDWLYYLTTPPLGIANRKAMADDPEKGMTIGTGCWKLVSYSTGDYITLERNDNYWGPLAYTKTLTMRYIAEVSTRTIMLQNKECQVGFGIGSEDIDMFVQDTDNYTAFPLVYNNPNTIAFNLNHPICGNYDFRMAVSCALVRDEISIVAAGDWAEPTYWGQVWGYGTKWRNPNIPDLVEDLDLAREYLAKSNYNGETLEICCAVETYIRASEVIQQQLEKIGIHTTINRMEGPALTAHTDRDNSKLEMQCYVTGFAMSPANARNLYYSTNRSNRTFYNNARVDELLDLAAITVDEDVRRDMYYEIQEIVAADPPTINTFWRLNCMIGIKGMGGMVFTPDNYFDLRYIYCIEE